MGAGLMFFAWVSGASLGAEEPGSDIRVRLEALEGAIEGLNAAVKTLSHVKVDGFVDLRYDEERLPNRAVKQGTGYENTADNGQSGFYARRAELKFHGKLAPTVSYALGYDFTENKHKDLGMEIVDIGLIPFLDVAPDFTWSMKVGQYRMPFGIMPQTSSSAIWFPERPIIFGARTNQDGVAAGTGTQVPFVALVGERVMGVQLAQKVKFGSVLSYHLQGGWFNNATQDQAAGLNRLRTAFPLQLVDESLTFIGRFSTEWSFMQAILPEKSKFQVGGSYINDGANANYQAQSATAHAEITGAELLIELANKMVMIQSEHVRRQMNINNTAGAILANMNEGWYADLALDVLPWIVSEVEKGDSVQLIGRVEEQSNYAATGFARKATRVGGSLKWSYFGGKNHTSISYFTTAPDHMYGGDFRAPLDGGTGISAPETTLIVQQQIAFGD